MTIDECLSVLRKMALLPAISPEFVMAVMQIEEAVHQGRQAVNLLRRAEQDHIGDDWPKEVRSFLKGV